MAVSPPTSERIASKRPKPAVAEPQSPVRTARVERNLTQQEVADLAGLHRNSIVKLENGTTKEVTSDNAIALARVLKTSIADLGLRVRAATEARSVRFRRLTPEQRQIVDELLSLPPEDFGVIRGAIERLRLKRKKKPAREARR